MQVLAHFPEFAGYSEGHIAETVKERSDWLCDSIQKTVETKHPWLRKKFRTMLHSHLGGFLGLGNPELLTYPLGTEC